MTFISPQSVSPERTRFQLCASVIPSCNLYTFLSFCHMYLLSDIRLKLDKLLYEALQIKFGHGWQTFSKIVAICSKSVFRAFLDYSFKYIAEIWDGASLCRVINQVRLQLQFTNFSKSCCPFLHDQFSRLFRVILLVVSLSMRSYRLSWTFWSRL